MEQTWQGQDSPEGTRTEARAMGTQSLRSGLAQAVQILLATEMYTTTRGQALGISEEKEIQVANAPCPP